MTIMKQMRKVTICLVCLFCLAAVLTACGSGEDSAAPSQTETPETTSVMAETAEDSETAAEESSPDEAAAEADSLAEVETEEPEDPTKIEGGASVDEALTILPNTRYTGTYREGEQWFAFTTGDKEDVPYVITVDNLTVGSDALLGYLCSEDGTWIEPTRRANNNDRDRAVQADAGGGANSGMFDTLLPGTTYYLRITGGKKADFSLRITDPNETMFDAAEGRTTISAGDAFEAATNMDEAPLLKFNTRYEGKYIEGNQWFAFTTGDGEDVPYVVTVDNLTAGSDSILGYVCDEYGTWIEPTKRANNNDRNRAVQAGQDGAPNSGMFDTLKPNTTYFLRLNAGKKAEYIVTISDPSDTGTDPTDENGEEPGTSSSAALNVPLGTKVYGRYNEGYLWFAFTTTEVEDAEYYVTVINCTPGSDSLLGYVCDKYGTWVEPTQRANNNDRNRAVQAAWDGSANSGMFNKLQPNTTYYIRMNGGTKADYSLAVYAPGQTSNAYSTSANLTEAKGSLEEGQALYTGTNQNAATPLKNNVTYHGDYEEGYAWVSFTTDEREDAEYRITVENLTAGSDSILGYVCDLYGRWLEPAQRANNNERIRAIQAGEDGTPNTCMFNTLEPDTTYYIRLNCGTKAEYLITIDAPLPEESGNTIEEAAVEEAEEEPEEAPEEVVFEVPFELNETQVRFKAESDEFIDPAAVQEALAPVAEIILEYPEHPILLAGTTATDGDQAKRVELSERRAAAVKKVLVESFAVPEEQLLTIGLGFEADPFERGRDRDSNGKFVETEGAKNRRVIVMDAESPVAKEILGTAE
jgi:outer membrane protein OmpA-like peptidoglycan-associated protein